MNARVPTPAEVWSPAAAGSANRGGTDPVLNVAAIVAELLHDNGAALWDAAKDPERMIFMLASGAATAIEMLSDIFGVEPDKVLDALVQARLDRLDSAK